MTQQRSLWIGWTTILIILFYLVLVFLPVTGADIKHNQNAGVTMESVRYDILSEWGQYGSAPGEFDSINDLLVGPGGNIYVSDGSNCRIQVFSPNCSFLRSWGGWKPGYGFTIHPGGIAADRDGTIYVPDSGVDRIDVFDPYGNLLYSYEIPANKSVGHFGSKEIAVDTKGNIFVTEPINKTIRKLNNQGMLEKTWKIYRNGRYQGSPGPMVTDNEDNLYVIDTDSGYILKYSNDGIRIDDWPPEKMGLNKYTRPTDITIGPDKYIYCSALNQDHLFILDSKGELIRKGVLGKTVSDPRIAVLSSGTVVMGDKGTNTISLMAEKQQNTSPAHDKKESVPTTIIIKQKQNQFTTHVIIQEVQSPPLQYPSALHRYSDGSMIVVDSGNDRVIKTDPSGNILFTIDNTTVPGGRFHDPGGIAIDASGIIHITNQGYGRIERFTANGRYLSGIGTHGNGEGRFSRPTGLSFGPDGNLYVADTGNNRIVKLDPSGRFLSAWGGEGIQDGDLRGPWGISVGPDGALYVTDTQNCRVQKFSPDGTWLQTWGSKGGGAGRFSIPTGIIADTDGTIYIADTNNFRIQRFDQNGVFLDEIIPGPSNIYNRPRMYGLVITAGDIYTTNTYVGEIIRFPYGKSWEEREDYSSQSVIEKGFRNLLNLYTFLQSTENDEALIMLENLFFKKNLLEAAELEPVSFKMVSSLGSGGNGPEELSLPGGITSGSDGTIYVADYANHRIQVFSSSGDWIRSWGKKGGSPGEFYNPSDIALDNEGIIYVADTNNHRIQKFSGNGDSITYWNISSENYARLARPTGISIDEDGIIYVADIANYRILKYSSDGTMISQWGEQGTLGGHLMAPFGIAAKNGYVLVTDFSTSGVKIYDTKGQFISYWGTDGTKEGNLHEPEGITADSNGNVYVADRGNNRIQKFNLQGQLLSRWVMNGGINLEGPADMFVQDDGHILVSDTGNNRIVKMKEEIVAEDVTSLDEKYARFSRSVDDWWFTIWENGVT